MTTVLTILAALAFLFRKPLGRLLAKQFPDRQKRRQVAATIIAAFVLMFGLRLLALLW